MSHTDAILTALAKARANVDIHFRKDARAIVIEADIVAPNGTPYGYQCCITTQELHDNEHAMAHALERLARTFINSGALPDEVVPGMVSNKTRRRNKIDWERKQWARSNGQKLIDYERAVLQNAGRDSRDTNTPLRLFDPALEDFPQTVVKLLVTEFHQTEESARELIEKKPGAMITGIFSGDARACCYILLEIPQTHIPPAQEV